MQLRKTPNPIGRVNGTRLRMLRKILADGMQTVAELADALGIEQRAVRDNATQAIAAGLLEKRLDGVTRTLAYSLTKAGRDYVLRRQHESEKAEHENATADHVAGDPHAQQAPEDVATPPMPPSDTEEESAAEEPCGEPRAQPQAATGPSGMMLAPDDVITPMYSTEDQLRIILSITDGERAFPRYGIDHSGVPPEHSKEQSAESIQAASPVRPDEPTHSSARPETKDVYAFAREDDGRIYIEWLTENLDDAIEEARTASSIDAVVFRLTPVCRSQRILTFYN